MVSLKKWAKDNHLPEIIKLKTRRGVVETKLILAGYCIDEVNYKISAKYPYSLHGEDPHYQAIDFSEGPMLSVGDTVAGMEILYIEPSCSGEMLIVVQHPDRKRHP